jgi:hypothetical protein
MAIRKKDIKTLHKIERAFQHFHVHQLEHPRHVEAHFVTPHLHVNQFQPTPTSILSL